jgi:RND family efflux transporter MFP subunit
MKSIRFQAGAKKKGRSMRNNSAARNIGKRAGILFLLSAVLLISGCDKKDKAAAPPPPPVTVASPVQQQVTEFSEYTGTTEAIEFVEIRARVEGYLQSIHFKDSALVNKDALLFIIDPREYRAALEKEERDIKSREAELKLAQVRVDRLENAYKDNAVSEIEVIQAQAERDSAEAAIQAARANVEKASLNLGYTGIRSPINGRVSRSLVDAGNLVGAGEKTLLTTIVKSDPMYVYFNVPEPVLLEALAKRPVNERRKPAMKFYAGLANEKGYPHEGVLDYIDNTVDPTTGTVSVRGKLPNKHNLLFPGSFVRIRVPAEVSKDALLVNERAIGTDLSGKYLLIVGKGNIVEHRQVQTGLLFEGMRVIEEGLEPGEKYIVKGLQRARPGMPVTPEEEKKEEEPAKTAPADKQKENENMSRKGKQKV